MAKDKVDDMAGELDPKHKSKFSDEGGTYWKVRDKTGKVVYPKPEGLNIPKEKK